jgi:3-oxoacyl-(acyl-carrier-protein) synthase/acyl carrier protein
MLSPSDIAIIGMAGKFPKASDIDAFWENIKTGRNCIGEVPASRFRNWLLVLSDKKEIYPPFGYLENIDSFDADFFGIAPGEASYIDPVQRLLLETVYEAVEFGGYGGKQLSGTRTGVYIACGDSGYKNLISPADYTRNAEIGNIPGVSAGRVSHFFDFRGPSMLMDTSCSSSLTALHYACLGIKNDECSMAVVGTVNIYAFFDGKGGNHDGEKTTDGTLPKRCRIFDDSADGIVNGEGAAALLLKPLQQAVQDGDMICAVIKGSAVNHNGARTPTIAAQKPESLTEVIIQALENARINPETVSYIEASGAGTPMGDSIEIKSISQAYSTYTGNKQFCALGSIKANIGHLNHASGLASVIKVILALRHKQIPPQAHFEKPNSYIDFKNSPVYIETKLKNWELGKNKTRRTGISSFSVNGTNCHIILEEAPPQPEPSSYLQRCNILTISAKNPTSLESLCRLLMDSLEMNFSARFDDICYTMNTGRGHYEYRLAVVAMSKNEALQRLNTVDFEGLLKINRKDAAQIDVLYGYTSKLKAPEQAKVVFLFSGGKDIESLQETYWDFSRKDFIAAKHMEECAAFYQLENKPQILYFAFQYALAKMWMALGIKPAFVLGFGIGKYVSKVISGTLRLEEALKICAVEYNREDFFIFDKTRFTQYINQLYTRGQRLFLEIGTETKLNEITQEVLQNESRIGILQSYDPLEKEKTLLRTIGHVYTLGYPLNFSALFKGRKVVLPTYPFHHRRYWVKSEPGQRENKSCQQETSALPVKPEQVEEKLTDIWQSFFGIKEIDPNEDFFQLGGDSLKAMTVISEIHKELNVKVPLAEFFNRPTIRELADYIDNSEIHTFSSIEPVEKRDYYPLSSAQRRFYFIHLLAPESTAYNVPALLILEGDLDNERLGETFQKLIGRHESLRSSFEIINEEAAQRIHKTVDLSLQYYNLRESAIGYSSLTNDDSCGESRYSYPHLTVEEIIRNFIRPFDLSHAPLLRLAVVKTEEKRHILMVDIHHIITDGVSQEILTQDFIALYTGEELPNLRLQYKDFSQWQNLLFKCGRMRHQERYWLERFNGLIPVLKIPMDYPRPSIRSVDEGGHIQFLVEKPLASKIFELIEKTDTTLYMVLLALYNIFLFKYTKSEDIVVGTPVAGRKHAHLQDVIGLFLNMLPMRNQIGGNKTFTQFLEEVKKNALEAYENQDYPYEELVAKLGLQGDPSRNPLFDTEFAVISKVIRKPKDFNLVIKPYPYDLQFAKFDLHFQAVEVNDTIHFTIRYYTALFKRSTVEKMAKHYSEILKQVLENLEIKLKDIVISFDSLEVSSNILEEVKGDFEL